jgi:predicted RNase H-like HicB family nuclease
VTSPDLPEASTFGENTTDALIRVADAIATALQERIAAREKIHVPSTARCGQQLVALPAIVAAKLELYRAIIDTKTARPILRASSACLLRKLIGCSISTLNHGWTRLKLPSAKNCTLSCGARRERTHIGRSAAGAKAETMLSAPSGAVSATTSSGAGRPDATLGTIWT